MTIDRRLLHRVVLRNYKSIAGKPLLRTPHRRDSCRLGLRTGRPTAKSAVWDGLPQAVEVALDFPHLMGDSQRDLRFK